jgi:hypothetical protein
VTLILIHINIISRCTISTLIDTLSSCRRIKCSRRTRLWWNSTRWAIKSFWTNVSIIWLRWCRTVSSILSSEFPCPAGTFNNVTHQISSSDCQQCSGGMYCDQVGLSLPAGSCQAGYFCLYGANSSTPSQPNNADICPEGFYCPSGTVSPQSCPPGTFNPITTTYLMCNIVKCSRWTWELTRHCRVLWTIIPHRAIRVVV